MGLAIKKLPEWERPRERFLINDINNITNEDLLAILLQTGTKGESAKSLALEVLTLLESLDDLEQLSIDKLTKIKGIGKVKAITILASLELGRRYTKEKKVLYGQKFKHALMIFNYYQNILSDKKQEYFYCIYLDNQKRMIKEKLLFIGTVNYSTVHPREIFKEACLISASAIICVHNHPSGNLVPSQMDLSMTSKLVETGKMIGIPIIDHIIIGTDGYYSFFENHDI